MKKWVFTMALYSLLVAAPVRGASIGTDVYGLLNNAANVYYQDIWQKKHHYRVGLVTVSGALGVNGYYRGLLPKSGALLPYWELGLSIGSGTAVVGSLGVTLDVATGVAVEPYLGVSAPGTTGIGINLAYELK